MGMTIENVKLYTVQEAASILHVTEQTVRAYVKSGKLKGQRIGRPILISEGAIRELVNQ